MRQIRNYSLLASAMLAFAFTACNNNDIETIPYEGPVPVQVTAGIDGPKTRAIDNSWENGDAIGISCTSQDNVTKYDNMKYVTANGNGTFTHYDGDTEDLASGIFFQGTSQVTFSAYYPFAGTEKTKPGTDGKITGSTSSQSTGQNKIDYLYAGGLTSSYATPNINFKESTQFKHKMSRLKLVLQTSTADGFSATDVTTGTYVLGGLKHEGTFDTTTGTAEAASTATALGDWSVSTNCPSADANSQRTYTMILYPQTVSGALPFTATISSQNYKNTANITFDNNTLAVGTSYTFTITIKKTGLEVSGCTIENWNPGTGGKGDAVM